MLLADGKGPFVSTLNLYDLEDGPEVARLLVEGSRAAGSAFNLYSLNAADQGAEELGVLPDLLPGGRTLDDSGGDDFKHPKLAGLGTKGIVESAISGELKALWLAGADLLELSRDRDQSKQALENVPFLVVQATNKSDVLEYASVVLPMTAPAESDGTYTNLERRVQRFNRVLGSRGEAKPAWRVYSELALRTKHETPLFNAKDVMEEIAKHVPAFEGARYDVLPEEGFVLGGS